MFQVTSNVNNYSNFARIMSCVLACLAYQFYVNWPGQKVFDVSTGLSDVMYVKKFLFVTILILKIIFKIITAAMIAIGSDFQ